MASADFKKEPWKHPAVWKHHLVKRADAFPDGVHVDVASCECGWAASARFGFKGHLAQTQAIDDHWQCVIAEAESEAVPA